MSLPVVNLTSDSEDSDDDVYNSFIVSSNKIPVNLNIKETTPKSTCSCKCNAAAQVDPLFRIIFRDEQTARKYRLRIEDILKYVLTSKINNENSESSISDLVLEVYDPATVPVVNMHSPRVPSSIKNIQVESASSSQIKIQQVTSHVDSSINTLEKKIKQEKITENEKKRKIQAQVPEMPPSNSHDLLDNNVAPVQKKIKVERMVENKTNQIIQPEPELKQVQTADNGGNSSALTIIYQKILKQEYPQENINLETCFENNSVQIGSYGYFHQDKSIFISKDGLTFFVRRFRKGKRLVILNIELDDIIKVLTHFSSTKPALFFFISKKAAEGIRHLLSMNDPNGPYIDAGSMNPIHQRIAISPSVISDESKEIIKQLFKNTQTIDINENYAESLLGTETPLRSNTTTAPCQKSKGDQHSVHDIINESKSQNELEKIQYTNQIGPSNNKNLCTILFCRVLRVGSFEYSKNRVFSIDITGIKFCIPHLVKVPFIVTVHVKIENIVRMRVSFSKECPVIFLHINAEAAERIRSEIGMNDSAGLDPDCGDETRNKIIILPQRLSEDCKIIKRLYKTGLIEKLYENAAHNILIKSFAQPNESTKPSAVSMTAASESDDSSNKNLCINFVSNSLRIGTYKCVQLDIKVFISTNGLNFQAPKVGSTVFKSISIPFNEITKVYYCFKKVWVLFFCTTVSCAERIRQILEMPDHNINGNVYFNPNSTVRAEQRLVIVFNAIKFHHLSILKNLLNHTLSEEVTAKVARIMMLNKL